ncbi:hypothetical protein M514_16515 [Trichuris suis]|uniref:WAP domain-containing protein n=1 Tax=Trichuris suis TaxID=68888 RepID=A0A085NNX2_9BILA|nr:hypothetical protein M514_16515 [Trichuris suis]
MFSSVACYWQALLLLEYYGDKYCPPVVKDQWVAAAALCITGADCHPRFKCCPTTLTSRCLGYVKEQPRMHAGYCPPDAAYGPVKQVKCENDQMCGRGKRCCQVGSKIKCTKSVRFRMFPVLKEGECPVGKLKKKAFQCKADQDCREKQICCDGVCRKPKPKPPKHDRYCPDVADDKEMRNAKLCNADSDCFDIQKCCPTSLTLRCQRPSQYAPLPKEGRCKEEQGHIPVGYLPSCTDDYDCMGMKKCCFQNGTIDCIDV